MAKRPAKPRASKTSRTPEAVVGAVTEDTPTLAAAVDSEERSPQQAENEQEATLRSALDQLDVQRFELDAATLSIGQREAALADAARLLDGREASLAEATASLDAREVALLDASTAMSEREKRADNTERALRTRYEAMVEREKSVAERESAMAQREAALATREGTLVARERALVEAERDVARLRERERDLTARARALDARDEELTIREAAADEAMSLASESMEVPRVPAADDDLLVGPDMPAPAISAAEVQLAALRQAEERHRQEAERAAADERRRIQEEAAQLLGLTRAIPALEQLGPRIQKALESMNYTVLVAFYNMAVRQVVEAARSASAGDRGESAETVAERQKALDDANALISSLKEDFNRYRTRVENEREIFAARANEDLLRRILPVADNFDRALVAASAATNVEAVLSGVRMIQRQFEDVMAQAGLVPIKAMGLPFDPRVHEALARVEVAGVPEDTVVEEVQRGYYLGQKVFRPAMVKVAQAVVGASAAPATSEG